MSLQIYNNIGIDNFMELWDDIVAQKWHKVFPNWHEEVINVWNDEIKRKFNMLKQANSYGKIDVEADLPELLKNARITYLPKFKAYRRPKEFYKDPHTYVKEGNLKKIFSTASQYDEFSTPEFIKIKLNIPAHPVRRDGYMELEESRSIFKASFVLSWPQIIRKTLEGVGK